MRVLYFSRDYSLHDRRFLTALAGTPHQVFFLRLERRDEGQTDAALPTGISPVEWIGGRRPARLADYPALIIDLRRVLWQVQPDLVHAGPLPGPAYLAARAGFRPLVAMSWGSDLLFEAQRSQPVRQRTRYTLRRTDVLVGDCNAVRQQAARLGFPQERVVFFPWGVDLAHFSPGEGKLRQELGWQRCFVLIANRAWEPLYGVEEIARAFTTAARQRPDLRLLLLAGGSQEALVRSILAQGGALDKVYFAGQVTQADLPDYYRTADLYLTASHSDGSSVSLMEALACGKPVLVSDIAGNREWIAPGETGRLFRVADAQSLAEGILAMAAAGEELVGMGRRARRLAEERADWSRNFPRLLDAYEMAWRAER